MPVRLSPRSDEPKPKQRAPRQRAPKRRDEVALEPIEQHLARGELDSAVAALLPELDRRGESGEQLCALAARLLRARDDFATGNPATPDALATALDRLVRLVQRQEEEIHILRGLVEERL